MTNTNEKLELNELEGVAGGSDSTNEISPLFKEGDRVYYLYRRCGIGCKGIAVIKSLYSRTAPFRYKVEIITFNRPL